MRGRRLLVALTVIVGSGVLAGGLFAYFSATATAGS